MVLPVTDGHVRLGAGIDVPTPSIHTAQAQLFVAPADITIVGADETGTPATVTGRTFHGPVTRVQLECQADGGPLALLAEMASRDALHLADGAAVVIRVEPESAICFPAAES
jgi:hypothetical protein